jgi:hypothetical protein
MNQSIKMAGVAVVGAGVGFFVGYKLVEKRLTEQFDQRLDEETSKMREFYSLVKKPYSTPGEAVEDLIPEPPKADEDPRDKNMRTAYHKIVQTVTTENGVDVDEAERVAVEVANIFDGPRDTSKPYVVDQDDFMGNATGFGQNTLTWYEADDTLVDERDQPIANPDDVVGPQFRVQFGEYSSDEKTVHIRNEKLGLEFEVVKSEGSYKREVLGEESG